MGFMAYPGNPEETVSYEEKAGQCVRSEAGKTATFKVNSHFLRQTCSRDHLLVLILGHCDIATIKDLPRP